MNNNDDWLNPDNIVDLQDHTVKGHFIRRIKNITKSLKFWIPLIIGIASLIIGLIQFL